MEGLKISFPARLGLEKWLHQNGAIADDVIEGVLNDDVYYCCKRGFAAVIWKFQNTNSNYPVVYFAPYKDQGACNRLWEAWDRRRIAAECDPEFSRG